MDYDTLVYDLKRYEENKKKLTDLKNKREQLFYIMTGVSGVQYDKQPGSTNPSQAELYKLQLIEEYNNLGIEIVRYEIAIQIVDQARKRIPANLWIMLKEKYIQGMTFDQIGKKYGYSGHGFWKYMRREVSKYL